MQKIARTSRVGLMGAVAALALAAGPGWAQPADESLTGGPVPEAKRGVSVDTQPGTQVPMDLPFLDESGARVRLGQWFNTGRPVVLLLVYFRCPVICPQTIDSLVKAMNGLGLTLGEQYNVVLVSFDPTEGPADASVARENILARATRAGGAAGQRGLAVLTDASGSAKKLAQALSFNYQFRPASNQFSHMGVVYVLTPEGRVARELVRLNYDAPTLRKALIEASEGRVGATLEQAALWCMVYDPETGTYKLAATRIMKVGGALSALAVGGVLIGMFVAERRRRQAALARLGAKPPLTPPGGSTS